MRPMKSPQEMDKDVVILAGYMLLGLIAVLIIILLLVGLEVVIGFLTSISMGV